LPLTLRKTLQQVDPSLAVAEITFWQSSPFSRRQSADSGPGSWPRDGVALVGLNLLAGR
jgi:hypothetical protein